MSQFIHGYALLIGVGVCRYVPWSLSATVKDAQALCEILTDPEHCAYPADDDHVRLLHDDMASRSAILDGLRWLEACCQADDQATAVVYFSGHGWLTEDGHYFLIPHDVTPFDIAGSALAAEAFTDALRRLTARRLLVFIDSCHAEGMAMAKAATEEQLPPGFSKSALPEEVITQLKQGEGRAVFTSSRGKERSWVRQDGQLSIYTYHLLEALSGAGNRPGDTEVHVSHLMTHLANAVPISALREHSAAQTPFFDLATEDFAVALLMGGRGLPDDGWQSTEVTINSTGQPVNLTGSELTVQGQGNLVVNAGGVNVVGDVQGSVNAGMFIPGGDYVGGNQHKTIQTKTYIESQTILDQPGNGSEFLRRAYLNRLLYRSNTLSLAGIDPRTAGDEVEARLQLSAVYTALMTVGEMDYGRGLRTEGQRLSALAQLNEHPRLVILGGPGSGKSTFTDFVTLCMAGAALNRSDINLELLTAPLPDEDGDTLDEHQPWRHGVLLPLKITLRDLAAQALPHSPEEEGTTGHLWRFVERDLASASLADYLPHLQQEILEQGGVLFLDGLDEVPETERRRVQVKQMVTDFAATYPLVRILVTSRTYAYQKQAWQLPGFEAVLLDVFDEGQIRRFIDSWYQHITSIRSLPRDDAQGRAELLKQAILARDNLFNLAKRPLLLTLMASLHAWRGGSLPEKREELYADTVDLLLDWWERPKAVRDERGQMIIAQPSLAECLRVGRDRVREMLNRLAYESHAAQPELVGTADLPEGKLITGLLAMSQNPDVRPQRLLEYLNHRAGLLLPRGIGVYTFPHRTFQEYLAACHLTDDDFPEKLAKLARREPNRWREGTLLAGAKTARGSASNIWSLADALCYEEPNDDPAAAWSAHLAGQALAESARLERISPRNQAKIERIRRWLVHLIQGRTLPAVERAKTAVSLALLGDPRPEVLDVDAMQFCYVPAGPFIMGSNSVPQINDENVQQVYDSEKPQHHLDLPYDYWIARYPVTNAQFAVFVADGGYENAVYWPEAQRVGVWKVGQVKAKTWSEECQDWIEVELDRPYKSGGPFHLDNHPVVGVSWYESLAFTRWLTERWKAKGFLQPEWSVCLPSEVEWEKAARGGLRIVSIPIVQPVREGVGQVQMDLTDNPRPQRLYPWGDNIDSDRANFQATGIGATNGLGCFAGGASPYGCEELVGNVSEWTRTLWGKTEWMAEFTYPYNRVDGRENLEASASTARVLRSGNWRSEKTWLRCSTRSGNYPDYRFVKIGGFRICIRNAK